MKIIVRATADAVADEVHALLMAHLQSQPTTVMGLPTGATPLPIYARLVDSYRAGRVSWKGVTTFNLDEYIGLGEAHPASYAAYMRRELFDHIDCPPAQRHIPNGMAFDADAESSAYEEAIAAAGGLDLMLLGLGRNGHIGFNEPGSDFASRTRPVDLTQSTLLANSTFFNLDEKQPTKAISMGIGTILEARRTIIVATGSTKAESVQRSIRGDPTIEMPGSALQLARDVTFVLDQAASSLL
jgi:glucosamine-6-phosphate deaminase